MNSTCKKLENARDFVLFSRKLHKYLFFYIMLSKPEIIKPVVVQVDGFMVYLASGQNTVWGVSANGELWYRAGIDQVFGPPIRSSDL